MNQKMLLSLWGGFFVVCAGLGFVPEPAGILRVLLTLAALGFFLPPALLLRGAAKTGNRAMALLIRNLSMIWLSATAALLVCNVLSLMGNQFTGDFLYALLVIVSAPMICGGAWVLSLFAWACLLFAAIHILKTMKTRT